MQIPRRARLGDLERAIMDRLWAIDPVIPESAMTVREIHESIAQERDIAYTTVMTVLDRMSKKGLVTRERDGRAWRYLPVSTSEELTADLLRDSLEHIESSDRRAAMLHFLDAASAEEIDDLKAALAELESRQGAGPGTGRDLAPRADYPGGQPTALAGGSTMPTHPGRPCSTRCSSSQDSSCWRSSSSGRCSG